jgi:hypothetical protein
MAVTNTNTLTAEVGNGIKVAFDFAFKIFAETDLLIYKETAAGVYTLQTIVADWGADPDPLPAANTCFVDFDTASETGTVTYSEAPATGLKSVIARATGKSQGSNLPLEEVWSKKVVENALDKLTLMVQELAESLARTVQQPFTPINPAAVVLAAPVDNKGLKFRYDTGSGKWYIESTTVDAEDIVEAAAASASAALVSQNAAAASAASASVSAAAAAASAAAAAASALDAQQVTSGLYDDKPLAPAVNMWYYSTDREQLERYITVAGKWFLIG